MYSVRVLERDAASQRREEQTFPSSTQRVSMTMVVSWCSHTICQNLSTVTSVGPGTHTQETGEGEGEGREREGEVGERGDRVDRGGDGEGEGEGRERER